MIGIGIAIGMANVAILVGYAAWRHFSFEKQEEAFVWHGACAVQGGSVLETQRVLHVHALGEAAASREMRYRVQLIDHLVEGDKTGRVTFLRKWPWSAKYPLMLLYKHAGMQKTMAHEIGHMACALEYGHVGVDPLPEKYERITAQVRAMLDYGVGND